MERAVCVAVCCVSVSHKARPLLPLAAAASTPVKSASEKRKSEPAKSKCRRRSDSFHGSFYITPQRSAFIAILTTTLCIQYSFQTIVSMNPRQNDAMVCMHLCSFSIFGFPSTLNEAFSHFELYIFGMMLVMLCADWFADVVVQKKSAPGLRSNAALSLLSARRKGARQGKMWGMKVKQ